MTLNCTTDIEDVIKQVSSSTFSYNDTLRDNDYKRSQLISWYQNNRRVLPWRGDNTNVARTAYGTWVSEVMLQQTRVDTVISYWNKWMVRFPTVESLALASPDEVNQYWAGLGYYRRAQQLLKGAQFIRSEFGGKLPTTVAELLRIPGIGPYTAGAIASIAYNCPEPLVDGNVIRVLTRLYAINLEIGAAGGAAEKACWEIARALVDPVSPGDFNQALMELGATVCKPASPLCSSCPVRSVCKSRLLADWVVEHQAESTDLPQDVTYFPRKVPKKKAKDVLVSVCVFVAPPPEDDNSVSQIRCRYLFNRRPPTGLLANQWEFPSVIINAATDDNEDTVDSEYGDKIESVGSKKRKSVSCPEGDSSCTPDTLLEPFPSYLRNRLNCLFVPLTMTNDVECKVFTSASADRISMTMFERAVPQSTPTKLDTPIVHVFSHQKHTMHVTIKYIGHIEQHIVESGNVRWMTAEEIVAEGITTGCKKILQAVTSICNASSVSSNASAVEDLIQISEAANIDTMRQSNKEPKNAFDIMRSTGTSNTVGKISAAMKMKTATQTTSKMK